MQSVRQARSGPGRGGNAHVGHGFGFGFTAYRGGGLEGFALRLNGRFGRYRNRRFRRALYIQRVAQCSQPLMLLR